MAKLCSTWQELLEYTEDKRLKRNTMWLREQWSKRYSVQLKGKMRI
jgi:hypothetical protein